MKWGGRCKVPDRAGGRVVDEQATIGKTRRLGVLGAEVLGVSRDWPTICALVGSPETKEPRLDLVLKMIGQGHTRGGHSTPNLQHTCKRIR